MNTIMVPEYICDICGKHSRSKKAIEQCEKEPYHPARQVINVGDRVRVMFGDKEFEVTVIHRFIPSYDGKWKRNANWWHHEAFAFKIGDSYRNRLVDECTLLIGS